MHTAHHNHYRKIIFCMLIFSLMLAACAGVTAEDTEVHTIGILALGPSLEPVVAGFKEGMTEYGYVAGENVNYLYSGAANSNQELDGKLQEIMNNDVDLLLTLSIPPTLLAQQAVADTDIPIVFAPINDPVGAGVVDSLTNPGSMITGIRAGGFLPKELEWLLQIQPSTKRVFLPTNSSSPGAVQGLLQLQGAAEQLGLEIVNAEFANEDELLDLLANIPDDVDAIMMVTDSLILSHAADFIKAANENRLPLASISLSQVEAGALFSYGPEFVAIGKQAARLVDQVLKGTPAGDIPIETAEFFLNVNTKTAASIGLQVPDAVLEQANVIIRD